MTRKYLLIVFLIMSLIFSLTSNVNAEHIHTYDYIPCGSDEVHIKICKNCSMQPEYANHWDRYQCLTPCGACGHTYSTPTSHTYDTWQSLYAEYGAEQHHKICSVYWATEWYGDICGAVEPGSLADCYPVGTTWVTSFATDGYHDEFKSCAYCEMGVYQGRVECFKALGNSTCIYCEGGGLNLD